MLNLEIQTVYAAGQVNASINKPARLHLLQKHILESLLMQNPCKPEQRPGRRSKKALNDNKACIVCVFLWQKA
jgi:hypothetical protein